MSIVYHQVKRFFLLSLAIAFTLFGVADTFAGDESLLQELIARQGELKTVKASFVQEKYDPMLGRPIQSKGKFYFKTGAGVRWEYEDVLVVYDGNVLYVYSSEANEAEMIKGEQGFMGPLAFDVKELMKDYYMDASRDGDTIRLTLRPKKEMPFESMEMIFEDQAAFPTEVSIIETTGNTSVVRFENINLNARLSADMFVFTPPSGTSVEERQFE